MFLGSADAVESATPEGHAFESPFPQTDLAIVGGRFHAWSRQVGDARLRVLLRRGTADQATLDHRAGLLLDAAETYLRRYEPLVGQYPFREFAIIENFFSSSRSGQMTATL